MLFRSDTWTFGYTPDLVAGVWTGNSDNSPMSNVFSTTIAWPTWRDFMAGALKTLEIPSKPFDRPQGVVERDLCWPSGRLPTDLCPTGRTYKGLMATDAIPTEKDKLEKIQDTWWQKLDIDSRTGLIAAPNTPAIFKTTETRLVIPKEEVEAWGSGYQEWAEKAGIVALLAPSADASAAASKVAITTPVANQRVAGSLTVVGRATSPDFQRYVLEWGTGQSPATWQTLTTATTKVADGTLGTWDVRSLPDGDYTLRLRVTDTKLGELRFAVPRARARRGCSPRIERDERAARDHRSHGPACLKVTVR